MAAYTAKDIRNLKKMIRFIENHNASIEEEELKKGKRRITDRLPIRQFFCDNSSTWSSMSIPDLGLQFSLSKSYPSGCCFS